MASRCEVPRGRLILGWHESGRRGPLEGDVPSLVRLNSIAAVGALAPEHGALWVRVFELLRARRVKSAGGEAGRHLSGPSSRGDGSAAVGPPALKDPVGVLDIDEPALREALSAKHRVGGV